MLHLLCKCDSLQLHNCKEKILHHFILSRRKKVAREPDFSSRELLFGFFVLLLLKVFTTFVTYFQISAKKEEKKKAGNTSWMNG